VVGGRCASCQIEHLNRCLGYGASLGGVVRVYISEIEESQAETVEDTLSFDRLIVGFLESLRVQGSEAAGWRWDLVLHLE